MLVVKQPSLSLERELNRFGIGQDFVIPDHAAVARQDIRGEVRVDLIRIGVLGQVLFNTEIKAPELVPVRFADLVGDGFANVIDSGSEFSSSEPPPPASVLPPRKVKAHVSNSDRAARI